MVGGIKIITFFIKKKNNNIYIFLFSKMYKKTLIRNEYEPDDQYIIDYII